MNPLIHVDRFECKLRSRDEWIAFKRDWPQLFQPDLLPEVGELIQKKGLIDPYAGWISGREVSIGSTNYRETITAHDINSRQRAVLLVLKDYLEGSLDRRIYASEAISPLANRLEKIFSNFEGSEYLQTKAERRKFSGVTHQDVQSLTLEDQSTDVYISCDVLEHIPDMSKAIDESCRVLREGGVFILTVPFAPNQDNSIVRSTLVDGEVKHLMEPQYHGNPTRPGEGSLVFQVPGWDIFEMFRNAGFRDSYMHTIYSPIHGIVAAQTAFIMVFVAKK